MNINSKLHLESYISDNDLSKSGLNSTILDSAIGGNEKNILKLSLDSGSLQNNHDKDKKKANQKLNDKNLSMKSSKDHSLAQSAKEVKITNLKKLYLL